MYFSDLARRRSTPTPGFATGDRAFHGIPRAVSRRSRGALAAKSGAYDSWRISRQGRSGVSTDLSRFFNSEFDIGKFRDVGHLVGVNRFNQAGGAIMDDFDNDGLLDIVVTSFDADPAHGLLSQQGRRNLRGPTEGAGVAGQLGGLVCYQADYNNDGHLDIFISRGAWSHGRCGRRCLRNNGDGGFTDVTKEAGLLDPVNSIAACWGDYDNDGWLDLFVGCERQPNRLYHNKGDGTFEEVAAKAGVQGDAKRLARDAPGSISTTTAIRICFSTI